MKNKTIKLLSTTSLALFAAMILVPQSIAAEKDTLNAADVKFVKQEAAAGMALVKLAGLGVQKAGNADVKAFAEMLVTDHTAANAELTKLATDKGIELSTVIDPKHAEAYQTLEKTSGTEFDKEFLAQVTSGHKKCVKNFEESSQEAKNSDLKAWVDKMLPALKTHLEKAKELASK